MSLSENTRFSNLSICSPQINYFSILDFFHPPPGKIGITLNSDWGQPRDPSNPSDQVASEIWTAVHLGWYAQPVFGNGDYPQHLKDIAAKLAEKIGLPQSTLPVFTPEDIALNKGRIWVHFWSEMSSLSFSDFHKAGTMWDIVLLVSEID